MHRTILVGRQHADAFGTDGQQKKFESNKARDDQNSDARQRDFRIAPDQGDAKPAGQTRSARK